MEGIVNRYAYAILALTHAEGTGKLHLIAEIIIRDIVLKLLHHLTGAFDMAG